MDRDRFVEDVLHGANRSVGASATRALLTPLAGLHRIALEAYLLPYQTGIRKRYRLPCPVVAVGNLSSGGTGKTPMTVLVAGHLQATGLRVVVLSRGHGGSGETGHAPRVVSDGDRILLGPEAGDEPVLLARLLPGVPVIVGRDRRRSGRLAVEQFTPDVVVLDDALQYWQLHRDLNIVLLDARRPFDNGFVLPRGLLREPPSHLARAGIVVLTRADRVSPEALATAKADIARYAPRAAVFAAFHAPLGWQRDGGLLPLSHLRGKTVYAFSGIADGNAFFRTVQAQGGATIADSRAFPDHFPYTAEIVGELAKSAKQSGAQAAVTTEKDLVKVGPLWPDDAPPLYALRIGMSVENQAAFWTCLEAALPAPADANKVKL